MSYPQQPGSYWDPDSKQYYTYDARSDSFLFQNGQRAQRPANIPRSDYLSASQPAAGSAHVPRGAYYPSASQSAVGAARGVEVASVSQSLASTSLQPTYQAQDANNVVRFQDPSSLVKTSYSSGPAERITDPVLFQNGVRATTLLLSTDDGRGPADEELFEGYRRRTQPRNFFTVGKVFLVLWAEPAGENATQIAATAHEPGFTIGLHGQKVFSKVRRFVVIRASELYCTCIPITSYGKQGVGKKGVKKSEHSIIFTGKYPPQPQRSELPQRGEDGMRLQPIRVDVDDRSYKLDELSRLDYAAVHTIQHNIKVKSYGKVNPNSMNALLHQFRNVWTTSSPLGTSLTEQPSFRPGASARSGNSISNLEVRRDSQSTSFSPAGGFRGRRDTASSASDQRSEIRQPSQGLKVREYVQNLIRQLVDQGYTEAEARKIATRRVVLPQDDDDDDDDNDDGGDDNDEEEDDDVLASGQIGVASGDGLEEETQDANEGNDDDEHLPSQKGPKRQLLRGPSTQPVLQVPPSNYTAPTTSYQLQSQGKQAQVLMQQYVAQGRSRQQAAALVEAYLSSMQNRTSNAVPSSLSSAGVKEFSRTDATSGIKSTVVVGVSSAITAAELQRQGVRAHKLFQESRGDGSRGDGSKTVMQNTLKYKISKNPQEDFKQGNVIEFLWSEPIAAGATNVTRRFGDLGATRMRRFIVVRAGTNACGVIPILTYNGLGVPPGLKSDHAIVYTGSTIPPLLNRELPTRSSVDTLLTAICVIPTRPDQRLDPRSRLNFALTYQINQQRVEMTVFGAVAPDSMTDLLYQYRIVNSRLRDPMGGSENTQAATVATSGSSRAALDYQRRTDNYRGQSSHHRPTEEEGEGEDENEDEDEEDEDGDEDEGEDDTQNMEEDDDDEEDDDGNGGDDDGDSLQTPPSSPPRPTSPRSPHDMASRMKSTNIPWKR